jgi:MFS family permease
MKYKNSSNKNTKASVQNSLTNKVYKDKNLYIITAIIMISLLGVLSIDPAIPSLAIALKVPHEQIGLIITAYLIPVVIGTPILGVLSDRIGKRKRILIPSLLIFAVGGALASTANSFSTLLQWRFIQGIGAASLESLAFAMIGDMYGGKMLAAAMGINASIIGITAAIYPLIGGILTGLSWRYPFLLSLLAIPIALLILTSLKLPKKETSGENHNLREYLTKTWSSLTNPQVIGLLIAVVSIFMMQFGACYTFLPILATESLGASPEIIGIILMVISLSLAFFAAQVGLVSKFFSERAILRISLLLYALALVITPLVNNVWMLIIPSVLFGAAEGIALPTIRTLLTMFSPEESRAGFMAVNATIQSVGQALGPLFASIAFGFWGIKGVFFAGVVFALVVALLLNILLKPTRFILAASTAPVEH